MCGRSSSGCVFHLHRSLVSGQIVPDSLLSIKIWLKKKNLRIPQQVVCVARKLLQQLIENHTHTHTHTYVLWPPCLYFVTSLSPSSIWNNHDLFSSSVFFLLCCQSVEHFFFFFSSHGAGSEKITLWGNVCVCVWGHTSVHVSNTVWATKAA